MESLIYDRSCRQRKNRRGTTMVVYALADPRNDSVRYVGITNNLLHRFNEHMKMSGKNERKNAWLKELSDAHMLPIMQTLEVVEVYAEARAREAAYIQAYQQSGADLLNDGVASSHLCRPEIHTDHAAYAEQRARIETHMAVDYGGSY